MNGVSEYYEKKEKLSMAIIKLYFDSLVNFDIAQVSVAITRHIESPDQGRFYPKIGCIKRQLEGGEVTPDMIISAAKLKRSPLGILARIHIGTWDLNNLGPFELKQRAIECQELLPAWKERAANGEYSDHEISIMIKHDVSPAAPFTNGISGPVDLIAMTSRIEKVTGNPKHLALIGAHQEEPKDQKTSPEQVEKIRQEIKKAFAKPKYTNKKPDMSEPANGN